MSGSAWLLESDDGSGTATVLLESDDGSHTAYAMLEKNDSGTPLGNRPFTMKTSFQKLEPQRRRPGPLSTCVKLIRPS